MGVLGRKEGRFLPSPSWVRVIWKNNPSRILLLTPSWDWLSLSLDWPRLVYANIPEPQGQVRVKKVGDAPEGPSLLSRLSGPSPDQQGCSSPISWGEGSRACSLEHTQCQLGLSAFRLLPSLGIPRPSLAFPSLLFVFLVFNVTIPNLEPLWELEGL